MKSSFMAFRRKFFALWALLNIGVIAMALGWAIKNKHPMTGCPWLSSEVTLILPVTLGVMAVLKVVLGQLYVLTLKFKYTFFKDF